LEETAGGLRALVTAEQLVPVVSLAKESFGYVLLSAVTAIDHHDHFQVAYFLINPTNPQTLDLRLDVERTDRASAPSLTGLFQGVNLQEREVFDLMGIAFDGHPDLRRVLLWPGFIGHPLQKDFEDTDQDIPWELAGMRPRHGEDAE
jgi:NADH:ubiquinone oxidoreductase subunit C